MRLNNNTGIDTVNFTVKKASGEKAGPRLFVSASARIEGKNRKRTRSVMCRGALKALQEVVEWRFAHTECEERVFSADMLDFDRLSGWFAGNGLAREAALSLDDELLGRVLK